MGRGKGGVGTKATKFWHISPIFRNLGKGGRSAIVLLLRRNFLTVKVLGPFPKVPGSILVKVILKSARPLLKQNPKYTLIPVSQLEL